MSCRFALLLISFSRCAAFYRFRTRAGCPTLPQQALLMGTESTECSAAGGRNARGRCRSPFDPHAPVIEEGRSAGRRESLEPQVLIQFLPTFVWSQKWVAPGRETAPQKLPAFAGTPYWTKMVGQSPPIPWSRPPSLGRPCQFTLRFFLRENACTPHLRRYAAKGGKVPRAAQRRQSTPLPWLRIIRQPQQIIRGNLVVLTDQRDFFRCSGMLPCLHFTDLALSHTKHCGKLFLGFLMPFSRLQQALPKNFF